MSYNAPSSTFDLYERTLRRVFWSQFLDAQLNMPVTGNTPAELPAPQSFPAEPHVAVYPFPDTHAKR